MILAASEKIHEALAMSGAFGPVDQARISFSIEPQGEPGGVFCVYDIEGIEEDSRIAVAERTIATMMVEVQIYGENQAEVMIAADDLDKHLKELDILMSRDNVYSTDRPYRPTAPSGIAGMYRLACRYVFDVTEMELNPELL